MGHQGGQGSLDGFPLVRCLGKDLQLNVAADHAVVLALRHRRRDGHPARRHSADS